MTPKSNFAFKINMPCTDTDTITVITPCTMQKVGKAPSRTDLVNYKLFNGILSPEQCRGFVIHN